MQFLLFLSAMVAGLTGLMSGDRSVAPSQMEQAVAAAVAIAEAAPVANPAAAVAAPAQTASRPVRAVFAAATVSVPHGLAPVDERRLE